MTKQLTEEQLMLGEFYAWLHRRAEHLRKQRAAVEYSGQEDATAAQNAPGETGDMDSVTDETSI